MGKITESSKSQRQKQKLFSQAGMIAVKTAKNNNLPITYATGDKVIKEYTDGSTEVLAHIKPVLINIPKKFVIK